jgi:hypothetical protein
MGRILVEIRENEGNGDAGIRRTGSSQSGLVNKKLCASDDGAKLEKHSKAWRWTSSVIVTKMWAGR